ELRLHRLAYALHRQRLREPRHAFDEHVTAREEAYQDALDHLLLADDDLRDFVHDGIDECTFALHQLVDGSDVAEHASHTPGRAEAVSLAAPSGNNPVSR